MNGGGKPKARARPEPKQRKSCLWVHQRQHLWGRLTHFLE